MVGEFRLIFRHNFSDFLRLSSRKFSTYSTQEVFSRHCLPGGASISDPTFYSRLVRKAIPPGRLLHL